jgi:hypothetical protein
VDTHLCDRFAEYITSGARSIHTTAQELSQIELLNTLMQTKSSPLHLFDDINQWAYKWSQENVFITQSKQRKFVLPNLQKRLDALPQFGPTDIKVELPMAKKVLHLAVFPFLDGLYSLLTDPEVMLEKNLLFHNNDPFCPPPADFGDSKFVLKDVNDGSLYCEAYNKHVINH